jgi:hypothetical protein
LAWHLKPSQTFTDAQLGASCLDVTSPGMATAPPANVELSRGWCGLLNASLVAYYLPSRTTTALRCHRKAKKIIMDNNHPSHCMFTPLSSRRRGQYRCIIAGTERLKNSFYLKLISQCNTSHFNNVYIYTVLYSILLYCILAYAALSLLIQIFIYYKFHSFTKICEYCVYC